MASSAVKKPMSTNQAGPSSSKGKIVTSILKKKIETSNKQQIVGTKNKSITQKVVKSEEKGKPIASKTPVKKVVKREKKVYNLPGQKHDPPEEREPLRIFYETLSKQIPTSEMAEFWMMEHGMLSLEKAKKAYEKKLRKQKQLRTGTPIKSPPPLAPPSRTGPPIKSPPPREPPSRAGPPIKSPPPRAPPSRPESSSRPKLASKNGDAKPKRKFVDDDDDDDDDDDEVIPSPKQRKA